MYIEFPFLLFEIEFDTHNFSQKQEQQEQRVPFSCCRALCGLFPANGSTDFDGKHSTSSCPRSCVYYVSYFQK